MKEVVVLLTDEWNDWEASYVMAVINSYVDEYNVKTMSVDGNVRRSMGGVLATVDYSMEQYVDFDHMAILIMPGGLSWEENKDDKIEAFVRKVQSKQIPIAAICGATSCDGWWNHICQ